MSSYNDLVKKTNSLTLSRYKEMLNDVSLLSEDSAINLVSERIFNLKNQIKEFSQLQTLTNENFINVSNLFKLQVKDINLLSNNFEKNLNEYEIKINTNQNNLINLLRRIRQKLNTLDLFNNSVKNIILEDFSTLQYIQFLLNEESQMNIDRYAKVATLGIDGTPKEIRVSDIYIGNESNGLSGSYYDTNFSNPLNVVNANANSYYECFKLNEGPLVLDLVFELINEEILNEIRVLPQAKFSNSDFEIQDIIFTSKNGYSLSIKKLVDVSEQTLKIRINEIESLNIFKFLPIRATRVSIKFVQKEYGFVDSQKIYSLAIKSISFIQNKYLDKSEFQGGTYSLSDGYYSLKTLTKVFPKEELFYKHYYSYTKNNNSSWESYELMNGETPLTLHDGSAINYIYKYKIERQDKAFETNETYDSKDYVLDIYSKSKIVNRDISPVYIGFNETFLLKSLKLLQPEIGVRTNDLSQGIKLATLIGPTEINLSLPFSLNDYNIKRNELSIIVNGNKWLLETNINDLTDGKFYLNSDNKTFKLKLTNASYYNVSYILSEIMPNIFSKPEGYYLEIREPFDFDKNQIKIKCLDSFSKTNVEIFPKGNESIVLEKTFLNKKNLEIKDLETDTIYTPDQENFTSFFDLNFLYGNILIKDESFINKDLEISYEYFEFKELEKDKFDIWFQEDKVKGLFISGNDFSLRSINESLEEEDYIFDILSGGLVKNNKNNFNEKLFVYLKNRNIIKGSFLVKDLFKDYYLNGAFNNSNDSTVEEDAIRFVEVDYINGKNEFLFLNKMEKDIIPSEDISDNIIANWNHKYLICRLNKPAVLDKKVYLYEDNNFLGEVISVAESTVEDLITKLIQTNSLGIFNNTSKICLLKFPSDSTIIENHYLSYWYVNESKTNRENPFMFSLDYSNGILYLNKPIKATSLNTIKASYKIGNFILNYYICNNLKKWKYDEDNKNIELFTEEILPNLNSKIKMIYGKSINSYNLKGLENYFSPLVYKIQTGLN